MHAMHKAPQCAMSCPGNADRIPARVPSASISSCSTNELRSMGSAWYTSARPLHVNAAGATAVLGVNCPADTPASARQSCRAACWFKKRVQKFVRARARTRNTVQGHLQARRRGRRAADEGCTWAGPVTSHPSETVPLDRCIAPDLATPSLPRGPTARPVWRA